MNTLRKFINFRRSSSCSWRWSSSRASSPRSFARAIAVASLSGWVLGIGVAAPAAVVPVVPPPLLLPPPPPSTPLGRSLAGAYGAIAGARVTNPSGAEQANFAYVQALQRARMGDRSGALAAAHLAQALAQSPVPASPAVSPVTIPQPAAQSRPAGVPIVENGVPLSPQLIVAQQEIELASRTASVPLDAAKAHYRAALDAYISGNAARSRSEARAAFDAAADALSTVK